MQNFPKSIRLVHQRDFDLVFKHGRVLADEHLVMHAVSTPGSPTRLGLSVSKRVGNAVYRNRWKRLMREAFRMNRESLPTGLSLIVRPRKGGKPTLDGLQRSFRNLTPRLAKQLSRL